MPIKVSSEGTGPIVVLVNGGGMTQDSWPRPFIDVIVQAGYRVVRYDHQDAASGSWNLGDLTAALAAVGTQEARGPHFAAVGQSLGALVVQQVLATRSAELFAAGLIASRHGTDEIRELYLEGLLELAKRGIEIPKPLAAALDILLQYGPATLATSEGRSEVLARYEAANGASDDMEAIYCSALGAALNPSDLTGVSCPTLVMSFAADLVAPPHLAAGLVEQLTDSEWQVVPALGHGGIYEAPVDIGRRVATFLAAHDPRIP